VVLSNPLLSPADFFEILAEKFALPHTSGSKGRFLLAFERDLLERHKTGGQTALVIDEAQSLSLEMFEEVRLLANLETETAKLVNVVLVGQPELSDRLNDPRLRQFKQRVVLRCALPPLDLESTASYIASRLRVVGAVAGEVFTKEAVRAIYEASRGIPRTIGVVCENALIAGYSAQKKLIDRAMVVEVCGGLDVPVNGRSARADAAVPDQDVIEPPASPPERRTKAHFWSPAPRAESRPESSTLAEPEATAARDRRRMFDFF
jgi:type II secretory pathway predicted ATPase ExeA